jgi:hypothetical protein
MSQLTLSADAAKAAPGDGRMYLWNQSGEIVGYIGVDCQFHERGPEDPEHVDEINRVHDANMR